MNQKPRNIKDAKRRRARRRRVRRIRAILCIVVLLLLCLAIFFGIRGIVSRLQSSSKKEETKTENTISEKKEKKKASNIDTSSVKVKDLVINTKKEDKKQKTVTITVSSIGDCTLGTDQNFNPATSLNAYYDMYGADYFFKNVRSILEKDDLSIVNMEGTLTESTTRAEKKFAFKGAPEYASILSGSSVEAANLANNHSRDYGASSYDDTIAHLEEAGITTFGYENVALVEIKGVKVGLTGIYELAEHLEKKQQVKENIAALKEAGAQLIIVNFHWGIEREYTPNSIQKELAHLAIDEGADLVIGHHPHVLQGIEKYKNKYIAYSLGNFCFGGNSNPGDKDTMIFQQTFTITKDGVEENDDINIIPCSLSSVSTKNDYCPTPLEGDAKETVMKKIEKYSEGL